jgi:hypothetical protein
MILSVKRLALALPFVVQFLYVLQGVFSFPYATGDAYSVWIFKGNLWYLFGWQGLADFLQDPSFAYIRPGYPLLLPLGIVGIYSLVGGVVELAVLGLYPLLYLVMIILLYRFLKPMVGKWGAYLAAFLWATTPVIERHAGRFETGFADLPLSLTLFVGTIGLWQGVRTKRRWWFVLGTLFLAASAHLKYEGVLWIVSLAVAGVVTFGWPKARRLFVPLLVALASILPWFLFAQSRHLALYYRTDWGSLVDPGHLARLGSLIRAVAGQIVAWPQWGLTLLGVGGLLVILAGRLWRSNYRWLLLALGFQVLGFSLIYVISESEIGGHVAVTLYRLLIQLLPILLWVTFADVSGKNDAKTSR